MVLLARIFFLYIVLFTSVYSASKSELYVTFEVINGSPEYREIMESKKKKYKRKGLNCYIKKVDKNLSLRCNDTSSADEYKKNLQLLESLNIQYKVVSIEKYVNSSISHNKTAKPMLKEHSTSMYSLRDGYVEYKKKNFKKAKRIFLELYNEKQDKENSYALSLIYFNKKDYAKVRKVLQQHIEESEKSSKLFYDTIVYEFNDLVNRNKNTQAINLRERYIARYPKLKSLQIKPKQKTLADGYRAYKRQDMKDAKKIFYRLYKENKNFENSYAMALVFLQARQYQKSRDYLSAYKHSNAKAKQLYFDSIVAEYYIYLKFAKNKKAIALQNKYIAEFPKLKSLAKPEGKYTLTKGYKAYNKKDYNEAKLIFTELYNKDKNIENSYALALVAYKQGDYLKVRDYLEYYRKDSEKSSNLYYNSIIKSYYGYCEDKNYTKAISFLKSYKHIYPKLQKLDDALRKKASILIANSEYDKAEKLLLENDFKDAQLYIFNEKYKKALLLREESQSIEAVRLLMPFVPTYTKASTFYAEVTFEQVSKHMANKNFEEAKNLLLPILLKSDKAKDLYKKIKYEQNIYEGWENYNNDKQREALKNFENACEISYENGCLMGAMNSLFKLKKYKKALVVAKKIYTQDKSEDAVYIAYSSALILNDEKRALFWYKLLSYKYKKIILYESEVTDNNYEILQNQYLSLQKENPNDFEIVENYLYFLKNLKKYQEFEKIMKNAENNFYSHTQEHALKRIKREYQNERFYTYFKNGQNEECFKYGDKILEEKDDVDYKRIHAWCAYKSEKYEIARELFDNIIFKYGTNQEDRYARFLSTFKSKNFKDAKIYLKDMKRHHDKIDRAEIAQFYIAMREFDEAQQMVNGILDHERRKDVQRTINRSYKYNKNKVSSLSGGVHFKKRSVADGLHSFTQYYLPLDIDIYDEDFRHYYIDVDILHLYDVFEGSSNLNSMQYGLGWVYDEDKTISVSTILPTAGIDLKSFKLELGTTPIGGDIDPALIANLTYKTSYNLLNIYLKATRSLVDDSMLSLVGLQIYRESKVGTWGRVVKNGVELGINSNNDYFYSLNLAYYPLIDGENVMENSQTKGVAVLGYSIPTSKFAYLDVSLMGIFDSYEKSSDSFTYGHGGYFSPEYFVLGNFVIEMAENINRNIYWRLKASIGYEKFEVASTPKYPILNDKTVGLSGTIDGYTEEGITYKIDAGVGLKLDDDFDFVGGVSYEQMKEFNTYKFGFTFIYSFESENKTNMFNSYIGHRMRSLLH